MVSNKSLKAYFSEHPDEKEILINDIQKVAKRIDRYLFKNLDVMPFYLIPENIMAITEDEIAQCTVGSACIIPGQINHANSLSRFDL